MRFFIDFSWFKRNRPPARVTVKGRKSGMSRPRGRVGSTRGNTMDDKLTQPGHAASLLDQGDNAESRSAVPRSDERDSALRRMGELPGSPRYGGRDSGLGMNGAEYENPRPKVESGRNAEKRSVPNPELNREQHRTSVTAAGPSSPTRESHSRGPATNRTGPPGSDSTAETAKSAGNLDLHPGEGGGALGMKGAGLSSGGRSEDPSLGKSQ